MPIRIVCFDSAYQWRRVVADGLATDDCWRLLWRIS